MNKLKFKIDSACWCLVVFVFGFNIDSAPAQVGSVERVHDPSIIAADGIYYVFCTGRGIPIRSSSDLYAWEQAGRVFEGELLSWANEAIPGARGQWAPHIAFFNGRYHLYYSVSTFGSQRSAIGLAINRTLNSAAPEYRWDDQGMVLDSAPGRTPFNAIDPAVFEDKDKRVWMAWGSFWKGIYMTELDSATGKRKSADSLLLHLAERQGTTAIEAPYLIERNGLYYLFVSFDQCCKGVNSTYKIMVGRSNRVTGPYVDATGKSMLEGGGTPVLAAQDNWKGPGHNSILQTSQADYIVHHTYDANRNGIAVLQIRPILWSQDGWPTADLPIHGPINQMPEARPMVEPIEKNMR